MTVRTRLWSTKRWNLQTVYDLNRDKKKKKKKTVKKLSSTTACRITTKIPNESSFQIPLHHHPINRKVSKKIDIPKKQSTVINSSITEYPLEKKHNKIVMNFALIVMNAQQFAARKQLSNHRHEKPLEQHHFIGLWTRQYGEKHIDESQRGEQ